MSIRHVSIKQQKGLTLIELMIGLLVGAIVAAGAISIFTGSVKSSTDNINLTRLNQDLRAMMDIMERDIRRAGFVTSDPQTNLNSVLKNPFFSTVTAGATTDIAVYDSGTCIVYSYNRDDDADDNGVTDEIPSTVDSNERLGFRLSDGKLHMRQSGATNENCYANNTSWENITEPEVEITGLTFTLTSTPLNVSSMINDDDGDGTIETTDTDGIPYGDNNNNGSCDSGEVCNTCTRDGSPDPACLYVRTVTIILAGRLRNDPTVTQTITEQVRVRNDKFLAAVLP
jgi:type IV pilus assembly protein PilW